jgi:hypothetical protein
MQTSMPWVRFEPTTPVFERAKTVHVLDRAATVIGTGVCIPIVNTEMLQVFINLRKNMGWHITELLGFRNKSILMWYLNAKHLVWYREISKPLDLKLLDIFVSSYFEISAHNALRITHLMAEVTFSTLWHVRTSECQRSLSLTSLTQITYQ